MAALRWRWLHERLSLSVEGIATVLALALAWFMFTGGEEQFKQWLGQQYEACEERAGPRS